MCTLAIYFQVSPDFPVVVAANRDEYYERPAGAPTELAGEPWVVAGQDLVAGGTWLGVNGDGVVAGIVNRRSSHPPDPTRRSRGLLCLEALQHTGVAAACARVQRDPGTLYNPFNLLIASPVAACVVGNINGTMTPTVLQAGLHVLTNLELNDAECPRIAKSYRLFDDARRHLQPDSLDQFLIALRTILSDHSTPLDPRSTGLPNNLCVHSERFGTRSSSLIIYSASERRYRLWHANGAPCHTAYREIPLPDTLHALDKGTTTR